MSCVDNPRRSRNQASQGRDFPSRGMSRRCRLSHILVFVMVSGSLERAFAFVRLYVVGAAHNKNMCVV